jgi:hypothetical protein
MRDYWTWISWTDDTSALSIWSCHDASDVPSAVVERKIPCYDETHKWSVQPPLVPFHLDIIYIFCLVRCFEKHLNVWTSPVQETPASFRIIRDPDAPTTASIYQSDLLKKKAVPAVDL